MNPGWQTQAIRDVCEVINGGTPRTNVPEYWNGQNLWITPAEMGKLPSPYVGDTVRKITDLGLQDSSAQLLPHKSVILSSRAPIGHLVINTKPMATNQGCKGLIPAPQLHYKFLYYYLSSITDKLNALGTGATFKELSSGKLKEVRVSYPRLPEQRRIVAILDEAFAGIETAKANAEQNLKNARALFAGQLSSIVSKAYRTHQVVSLAELASDVTDGDHMPPPKADTGVPFVTIGNVNKVTRQLDFSETFLVPQEYYDKLKPNKKPKQGDVLYTVTGSFGIPVLVDGAREFCFQRHIGLIRPRPDTRSRWLYYLLLSREVFNQADEGATGTAQRTVSLGLLRGFKVPKPPPDEQDAASRQLDAIAEHTERLEAIYQQKLDALDALKKSLLHQAFTGALTEMP